MKLAHLDFVVSKDFEKLLQSINNDTFDLITRAEDMRDGCFIVTDMLMCDMGHIEKSSAAAFQGDKNPGIATEIRGIHMHDSFARHRGLFPFKTHCGQQTLDG